MRVTSVSFAEEWLGVICWLTVDTCAPVVIEPLDEIPERVLLIVVSHDNCI